MTRPAIEKLFDALVYLLFLGVIGGGVAAGYSLRGQVMPWFGMHSKSAGQKKVTIYTCGMHPQVRQTEPGLCPICQMKLTPVGGEKKPKKARGRILYWRAPMNPQERYDGPGKTAMGMDRVPVYEHPDPASVEIDPATIQLHGVRYVKAESRALVKTIRAVGHIDYDERTISVVSPRISGWIEELYVNAIGRKVKRGDALVALYSPELISTQEEYLLALKYKRILKDKLFAQVMKESPELHKVVERRLELWDVSKGQIRRLAKSGKIRRRLVLHARTAGIVIEKPTFKGRFVKAGQKLFTLADLSTVWVYAHLYQSDLLWVRIGEKVTMELSIPGDIATPTSIIRRFVGKVSYVYPYMDPTTRTLRVRLEFENKDGLLRPGMYTTIALHGTRPRAIVIPQSSVILSGKRDVVLLRRPGGRFLPREVVLGTSDYSGHVEVVRGLAAGEEIVENPSFLIASESRLREVLHKLRLYSQLKASSTSKPTSKAKVTPTSKPTSAPTPKPTSKPTPTSKPDRESH